MRSVALPHTSLRVSALCLGTGDIGSKIDNVTSFRMFDQFVEGGGTFIDTASVYSDWIPGTKSTSEKTIGAWLQRSGKRDAVVIATKGGHPELNTMHIGRLSRQEIMHDLNASLVNLRTDVIDFYWLHRDDTQRPVGEIIETLNEQVNAGKIRHFGCSNWRVERIRAANVYAGQHGLQGFTGDQMLWNLAAVDMHAIADKTIVGMNPELYLYHQTSGLAAIPYTAQANGLFQRIAAGTADKMRSHHQAMYRAPENQARAARAQELARRNSLTVTQVALGYLMSQPFVTVPIVGCQSPVQLADSLRAGDVQLSAAEIAYLAEGAPLEAAR